MRIHKVIFLVLIVISCVYTQQNQYQPYPYGLPNYAPQNAMVFYEPISQQQVAYYTQPSRQSIYYPVNQPPQQPIYYPVNQPLQQQTASSYPINDQLMAYPYPYQYGGRNQQQLPLQQLQPQPITSLSDNQTRSNPEALAASPDLYSNVQTEIIDVNPTEFIRIMQQLHAQPTIVSYENRVVKSRRRHPHYTVTTESKQSNRTSIPNSIHNYKITSKIFTFNKTFVLHPGDNKNSVVNLSFVNGQQVTDAPKETETMTVPTTTTPPPTTTESEEPEAVASWF